jgi:hypothetical protein
MTTSLYYFGCRSASEASQLEAVPVQMNRVNVVAGVPHTYPVSLAFVDVERCCSGHGGRRIGETVNRPSIEPFVCGVVFGKEHIEGFGQPEIIRANCLAHYPRKGSRRRSRPGRNAFTFGGNKIGNPGFRTVGIGSSFFGTVVQHATTKS